jgi:hypothetical protein
VRLLVLALLALPVAGCRFSQLPDPNERPKAAAFDGEALQQSVRRVDETLTDRLIRGEINAQTKRTLFHDYIREKTDGLDLSAIPEDQVWRYADVYRQLEDWHTTEALYKRAVASAEDEDRRVNDTLRLAEAKAALKDVPKGIELARSTFDVAPEGKAPILLAVLYEFAPAALGQGHDLEVAQLVEDAMQQHLQTIVDPKTDAGQMFLEARLHHLSRGWELVTRVYRMSGDEQAFRGAIERADAMQRRFAQA